MHKGDNDDDDYDDDDDDYDDDDDDDDNSHKITATSYTLETWFVPGIKLYIACIKAINNNNNNNNNNNKFILLFLETFTA